MPIKSYLLLAVMLMTFATIDAQNNDTTGVWKEKELKGVTIRSGATTRRVAGAVSGTLITKDELFKANQIAGPFGHICTDVDRKPS